MGLCEVWSVLDVEMVIVILNLRFGEKFGLVIIKLRFGGCNRESLKFIYKFVSMEMIE